MLGGGEELPPKGRVVEQGPGPIEDFGRALADAEDVIRMKPQWPKVRAPSHLPPSPPVLLAPP